MLLFGKWWVVFSAVFTAQIRSVLVLFCDGITIITKKKERERERKDSLLQQSMKDTDSITRRERAFLSD